MQKAFEKIIKTLEKLRINSINEECPVVPNSEDCEAEQCCTSCFLTKAIKIVNQVAEEYATDTGNAAITAWETVYKQILKLEKEYFEAGDVKNSDELIKLQNLLRHYKEQLTEEADGTSSDGWIQCSNRLPNEEEMKRAYCRNHYGSEFIVMIKGASKPTTLYRTMDGFWVDEKRITYTVLAWQPLPEPYQSKVCVNTECCYNQNAECPASDGCAGFEQKISNGDRIRAMSDEELAIAMMELGIENTDKIPFCTSSDECTDILEEGNATDEQCRECLVAWLKRSNS